MLGYTEAVRSKPRYGWGLLATLCLLAILAAALAPAGVDLTPAVLASLSALVGASATLRLGFDKANVVPVDSPLARRDPARGPPSA